MKKLSVLFYRIVIRLKIFFKMCICTKVCDCQSPPPDDWDGEGDHCWLMSNECPIHNDFPDPNPECPIHSK